MAASRDLVKCGSVRADSVVGWGESLFVLPMLTPPLVPRAAHVVLGFLPFGPFGLPAQSAGNALRLPGFLHEFVLAPFAAVAARSACVLTTASEMKYSNPFCRPSNSPSVFGKGGPYERGRVC